MLGRRRLPRAGRRTPTMWLLVGLFAAGYAIAIVRLGPRWAPAGPARCVTRFQITCWSLGVFAMWMASDYPIHDIAERYNFSVHMVQHLMFTMVVAPLLLLGMPAWLLRRVLAPRWLFDTVRTLARFIPALVIFNVVLVFTHWPLIVNEALTSGWVHFLIHALLLVSSLIVWMPIVSPLPEIPRLAPVLQMLYLLRVVGRADGAGVVPDLRLVAAVQVLRTCACTCSEFHHARGSAGGRTDHENRCRTPPVGNHRRSVLPLGLRGGAAQYHSRGTDSTRWIERLMEMGAEEMSDTTTVDETGTSEGEANPQSGLPEIVESEYLGADGAAEDTPLKSAGAAPVPRAAAVGRDPCAMLVLNISRVFLSDNKDTALALAIGIPHILSILIGGSLIAAARASRPRRSR